MSVIDHEPLGDWYDEEPVEWYDDPYAPVDWNYEDDYIDMDDYSEESMP